jgi:phosphotransferase system HPr-like phosphotransfer protein
LIGLVVMPDMEVVLEVDGPDAAMALEPLCEILAAPGGEDYTN